MSLSLNPSIYLPTYPPVYPQIHYFPWRCRAEANLSSQLEERRQEGGDTSPLNCLGFSVCSQPSLPAPSFLRMRQVSAPARSILGGRVSAVSHLLPPPPLLPRPIRALGEGCSGQGFGVARRQQRPVSRSPSSLRVLPLGPGCAPARAASAVKQPRGAPQHGDRGSPRSLPQPHSRPCQ